MYKSGQFIHLFGLREDWFDEHDWLRENDPYKKIQPGSILNVTSNVYSIVEIFLFLKNMVDSGFYQESLQVQLSLLNTENRQLQVLDPGRAPLFHNYTCYSKDIILETETYLTDEVSKNYLEIAFQKTIEIMYQFKWENPPESVIKEMQRNLIQRKI